MELRRNSAHLMFPDSPRPATKREGTRRRAIADRLHD